MIDDRDYRAGFVQGFRAIRGIERGKRWDRGDLMRKE